MALPTTAATTAAMARVPVATPIKSEKTHVLVEVPPQVLRHVGTSMPVVYGREAAARGQEELVLHVLPVPLKNSHESFERRKAR